MKWHQSPQNTDQNVLATQDACHPAPQGFFKQQTTAEFMMTGAEYETTIKQDALELLVFSQPASGAQI